MLVMRFHLVSYKQVSDVLTLDWGSRQSSPKGVLFLRYLSGVSEESQALPCCMLTGT